MRLTYKAKNQYGKETGTVWYASSAVGDSIFPKSDKEEQVLKKLSFYEDAEENGLLVILPCKVGDMVWVIVKGYTSGEIGDDSEPWYRIEKREFSYSMIPDFNKTIFLTSEEAEVALRGAE